MSLKGALERLLDGSSYHMVELFRHPEHAATWADALDGQAVDWDRQLDGYVAAVDWPASRMWRELSAAYPEAMVVLSVRESAEQWWRSMDSTVFARMRHMRAVAIGAAEPPQDGPFATAAPQERAAMLRMFRRLSDGVAAAADDKEAAVRYYERHCAQVRAETPADRLLEWKAADGWAPLCAALGVPVPDEPFPHVNTTEQFTAVSRGEVPGRQ